MTFYEQTIEMRRARMVRAGEEMATKAIKTPEPEPEPEPVPVHKLVNELEEMWLHGRSTVNLTVREIQRLVCKKFGIDRLDIISSRRTAVVILPRQIAMYLCRTYTTRSMPDIGRQFGGRDHTTILHGYRKICRLLVEGNPSITKIVRDLDKQIMETSRLVPYYVPNGGDHHGEEAQGEGEVEVSNQEEGQKAKQVGSQEGSQKESSPQEEGSTEETEEEDHSGDFA